MHAGKETAYLQGKAGPDQVGVGVVELHIMCLSIMIGQNLDFLTLFTYTRTGLFANNLSFYGFYSDAYQAALLDSVHLCLQALLVSVLYLVNNIVDTTFM
jgi:hypothetical protein